MGLFAAQVINDDTLNDKTNQRHSHNRDKGGDEPLKHRGMIAEIVRSRAARQ
jgi:hypothetical protein